MFKGIILATSTIVVWILLQVFMLHLVKTLHRFRLIFKLYLLSLLFYILLQTLNPQHLWPFLFTSINVPRALDFANGLLLHVLLFYTYVALYYYVDRPITLRILTEVHNSPLKAMTLHEIQSKYSLKDVIERRLNLLMGNGYVHLSEGRLFLTKKGAFVAKIFSAGNRLYGKT